VLIKAGADVNARGEQYVFRGQTALVAAAGNGNLDIVNSLVKAGADVNAKFGGTYYFQQIV